MARARALVLAAPLAALLLAAPAAADPVAYRVPVPGPVIDPYRPPDAPYGPGNRGIDYATTPGEPVGAAADGEVTFAGAVAGGLHVVVLHADGIRTSLSFLAAVIVRRGQPVVAGQPVGRAASSVHFGARRGEAYLDPATLLAGSSGGRAVLVPEGPGRPLGVVEEAAGLRRLLAGGGTAARAPSAPSRNPSPAGRSGSPVPVGPPGVQAAAVGAPPAGVALMAVTARCRRRGGRRGRPRGTVLSSLTAGGEGYAVRSARGTGSPPTPTPNPSSRRHPTVAPSRACPAGSEAPTEGEQQAWPSSP